MGNSLCTSVTKRRRLKKKQKFASSTLTTSLKIEEDDHDDAYFTPKTHQSETEIIDDIQVLEIGQSSNSVTDHVPSFVCEICVDTRPLHDSFDVKGCTHFYCTQCMVRYVASKLDDNVTRVPCPVPNCQGEIESEYCRSILPYDVFVRWGNALCESAIVGHMRFYCPYKDCSALLINEEGRGIQKSECPFCKRLLCVQCKAPWHAEFECGRFQELSKLGEDAVMTGLAEKKKWRRCPNCKHFVEKSEGCSYIKCRCGYAFCYNCGAHLSKDSHTYKCPRCKR